MTETIKWYLQLVGTEDIINLLPGINSFGRGLRRLHFRIRSTYCSGMQCNIYVYGDCIKIKDHQSTNSTYINQIQNRCNIHS